MDRFLDEADQLGKNIPTDFAYQGQANVDPALFAQKNVSHEARLLKKMFLKVREW